MSAPLGNFVPRPAQTGDQFQARFAIGRPLLVQVVSVDGARSVKDQQTGQAVSKKAVVVNVWDLAGGQVSVTDSGQPIHGAPNTVYANVLWMAPALVDNLEPYVGAPPMPLIINSVKGKNNFNYLTPVAVDGPMLQQVQALFAQDPGRIDREVAAKMQAAAAQAAAPQYQQSGFQPMQVQPSAPVQVPQPTGMVTVNGQQTPSYSYQQAPAAAQFQPPAPQQYAQPVTEQSYQQVAQPQAAPQYQQAPAMMGQMAAPAPSQQVHQFAPPQGQPQFQQPAPAAQFQGGPAVQNSDVQAILQGLAQGQPQQ